ncbi:hypothetical protein PUN28_011660 [Cardiocondyla obscurior]|uniref:Uncharacterized protein n=1 Tax=Cardiocondyla obscurior TaxID=286306 RepID=A0AAW2FF94_9HYME
MQLAIGDIIGILRSLKIKSYVMAKHSSDIRYNKRYDKPLTNKGSNCKSLDIRNNFYIKDELVIAMERPRVVCRIADHSGRFR